MYAHSYRDTRFQSTPSAWRETGDGGTTVTLDINFNPLPPHGGRPIGCFCRSKLHLFISIHSLRMEGDQNSTRFSGGERTFQSTPSAWRETQFHGFPARAVAFQSTPSAWRETLIVFFMIFTSKFQSTPSAWRETAKLHRKAFFISPILVQSCKKGCKRLHSAPEKMVFFEKREKNLVRNLQHLSVRL